MTLAVFSFYAIGRLVWWTWKMVAWVVMAAAVLAAAVVTLVVATIVGALRPDITPRQQRDRAFDRLARVVEGFDRARGR